MKKAKYILNELLSFTRYKKSMQNATIFRGETNTDRK